MAFHTQPYGLVACHNVGVSGNDRDMMSKAFLTVHRHFKMGKDSGEEVTIGQRGGVTHVGNPIHVTHNHGGIINRVAIHEAGSQSPGNWSRSRCGGRGGGGGSEGDAGSRLCSCAGEECCACEEGATADWVDAELSELWSETEGESGMVTVVLIASLHAHLEVPAAIR
ncbi:hypothetical protein Cgig2_007163 [Carnegiea gigantea]|uniref:Uncharacterized protein n=1 Tax=Carnegiea gigantea TaxID=171969 RepID=A0A9Q1GTD5_9CARY|nr:hypothetical protein Cgig2_007163 [Carnegiea gigantea]